MASVFSAVQLHVHSTFHHRRALFNSNIIQGSTMTNPILLYAYKIWALRFSVSKHVMVFNLTEKKRKRRKKRKETETYSEVFPSSLLSFPSLEKMGVDSFIFVLSLL